MTASTEERAPRAAVVYDPIEVDLDAEKAVSAEEERAAEEARRRDGGVRVPQDADAA